jgi:hypothetical protein
MKRTLVFASLKIGATLAAFNIFISSPCCAAYERCRQIETTKERVACLNEESAAALRANHGKDQSQEGLDLIKRDNETLDKRMKTICRGC